MKREVALLVVPLLTLVFGCEATLSPAECEGLRLDAFAIRNNSAHNAPHTCATDADCVGTTWPGCAYPVSAKNNDKIMDLKKKFSAGKCEEPKKECRKPPEVYCKQGLCVFREKAAAPPPAATMTIE